LTNDPVLFAYAVRDRPRKKSVWTKIGAAWPHDRGSGLTLILKLLPIQPRIVLVEPSYDLPVRPPDHIARDQPSPDQAAPPDRRPSRDNDLPVLIAYAVKARPGKKPAWSRIGAAWAHEKGAGLTVLLNLMPIEPRIILVEPTCDPPSPARRSK
jgi:hypothetical protein